jgi:hypothetical protein
MPNLFINTIPWSKFTLNWYFNNFYPLSESSFRKSLWCTLMRYQYLIINYSNRYLRDNILYPYIIKYIVTQCVNPVNTLCESGWRDSNISNVSAVRDIKNNIYNFFKSGDGYRYDGDVFSFTQSKFCY